MSRTGFATQAPKRPKRRWKVALPLAGLAAAVALVAAPSASSLGQYADAAGDNGTAGDITALAVSSDASGQIFFRITGNGLSTSATNGTYLVIDADANPATGDPDVMGAEYYFYVDDGTYWFARWDGADWVDTTYDSVRVSGGSRGVTISVNRSELGNTGELNFWARTFDDDTRQSDDAPDDGMFNYSLQLQGVHIVSAIVQTTPAAGPRAGKRFGLTVAGLKLPPDGRTVSISDPKPESSSCKATLGGRAVVGTGTGGCAWRLPKTGRGKTLKVIVTVVYQGTAASFPYSFKVR
jgi:hypothetical protein